MQEIVIVAMLRVYSKWYFIWYYDRNIDTDKILYLLSEWYSEYYIYASSTIHMREYYNLKYHINDTDNPMYVESLSGGNTEK